MRKLDPKIFKKIIRSTPLVAIDLIIFDRKNRVLLGFRKNPPAKNFWFVPGGRVLKNEPLKMALGRILKTEAKGLTVGQPKIFGVTEHFYRNSFFGSKESTHYVVIAFLLRGRNGKKILRNTGDQHRTLKWWAKDDARQSPQVHFYSKRYLKRNQLLH